MNLLKDEIASLNTQFASQLPVEVLQTFAGSIQALMEKGVGTESLKVGDLAPNFTLPNVDGRPIALSTLLRQGPVVISFQRGGWCPYCSLELKAWSRSFHNVLEAGASIVAITPEVAEEAEKTKNKNEVSFEVLVDSANTVARKFGLVFELQQNLRPIYAQLGADLEKVNGDSSFTLPIPATYVIGQDSIIKFAHVDPNYMNRAEPKEILNTLTGPAH